MADAIRNLWHNIVNTKRTILNPHEHYGKFLWTLLGWQPNFSNVETLVYYIEYLGRANITRAVILSYVGIYLAFKWNQNRKAKKLEAQKLKLTPPAASTH
jgi:hypothetical protein